MTSSESDEARDRAVSMVADAVGELMRFWNFKPSLGRIWAVLYLSPEPLDAAQIEARSGLSTGNVSMSLQELLQWGVVKRVAPASLGRGGERSTPGGRDGRSLEEEASPPQRPPDARRRLYTAETDMWAMISRVFRERELRLVERTIEQLEEAIALLDGAGRGQSPSAMHRSRFLATRVQNLLELARVGRRLLDGLSRTGAIDLSTIRNLLRARA